MGEKRTLSEDERLTPDNGKVMATDVIHQYPDFWLFRSINWKTSNQLCTSLEAIWPPDWPGVPGSNLGGEDLQVESLWLCPHTAIGTQLEGSSPPG